MSTQAARPWYGASVFASAGRAAASAMARTAASATMKQTARRITSSIVPVASDRSSVVRDLETVALEERVPPGPPLHLADERGGPRHRPAGVGRGLEDDARAALEVAGVGLQAEEGAQTGEGRRRLAEHLLLAGRDDLASPAEDG